MTVTQFYLFSKFQVYMKYGQYNKNIHKLSYFVNSKLGLKKTNNKNKYFLAFAH